MFKIGDIVNITIPRSVFENHTGVVVRVMEEGLKVYVFGMETTYIFRKDQLELSNPKHRHPWEHAPSWAVCAATDADGSSYWYDKIVHTGYRCWNGWARTEEIKEQLPGWKESLEMRPDEFKPKPETKPKKMTVAEIEKALGHPVEVVK